MSPLNPHITHQKKGLKKGIYRFDPDIYKEVLNTPFTGDLPHEIFFNLPEWCVYIETPGQGK